MNTIALITITPAQRAIIDAEAEVIAASLRLKQASHAVLTTQQSVDSARAAHPSFGKGTVERIQSASRLAESIVRLSEAETEELEAELYWEAATARLAQLKEEL